MLPPPLYSTYNFFQTQKQPPFLCQKKISIIQYLIKINSLDQNNIKTNIYNVVLHLYLPLPNQKLCPCWKWCLKPPREALVCHGWLYLWEWPLFRAICPSDDECGDKSLWIGILDCTHIHFNSTIPRQLRVQKLRFSQKMWFMIHPFLSHSFIMINTNSTNIISLQTIHTIFSIIFFYQPNLNINYYTK